MVELGNDGLLGLSHDESDDLSGLLLSDGSDGCGDNLDEYLAPLLSTLNMLSSLLLLNIFIAKYFTELFIILVSGSLFELLPRRPHEYLLLDPLSLPHVFFLRSPDLLPPLRLRVLPALLAPLLHLLGLKLRAPLVSLLAHHRESGCVRLLVQVEVEGACVRTHASVHRLEYQVAVVAEA